MSDPISPQTRAFAQEVLGRAKQAQADVDSATLPPVPADLAGWAWERSDAGTVRLSNQPDGLHTRYYPPTALATDALDEARAIIAGEAALVAAEGGAVTVVAAFRYEVLSAEARIVVQQAAKEIRDELDLMRQSAIKIGRRLVEVKAALPHGGWGSWLRSEFGWSDQTATNYMRQAQLAAQNPKFLEFEDRIEPSARTLLAAPSTPEPAREEALRRAEAGETVRHRDAKEIVGAARAEAAPASKPTPPPAPAAVASVPAADGDAERLERAESADSAALLIVRLGGEYAGQTNDGRYRAAWAEGGAPVPYRLDELRRLAAEEGIDPPPPPPAAPARPVPAPAPAILDGVGRQPYGARGADRWVPAVPHVLIIGERSGYYSPPPLIRAATIYDTPTTVRVRRPDGKEETQSQHKVWAVPDDAAWTEIEVASAVFATALAEYADVLRELGRYADQLDAAGGMKGAPNPLCATVARSEDPDHTHHSTWFLTAWFVPYLERKAVDRHTPKMLVKEQWGNFAQDDSFVLADDAAWERVSAAQQACKDAATAAEQLLHRLGTYDEALDGRHQKQPAPAALSEAELAAADRLAAIQAQIAALGYTLRQDHQGLAVMDGAVMLIGVGANNVEELGRQVAQLAPLDDLAAPLARAGAGMRAAAAAQEAAALGDAGEDLGAHLMAAVGAILGGLPEPAVRILAAHLCFGDVSDVAFTAPIEAIYDGFAEVASQGDAARMPLAWRAGARAALATLGLTGMPQKAAAD